uniref:Uncharacterized protein n=1 Tax=Candidatus Kentrum sp. LFY TaxID=2126342 RepID=A0A450UHR5_9GAMM|nr:MAG: hypothetical protein BECKLFY1418B_GA0070995_10314 [Candidatus Kentron sp. LFY]
MEMIETSALANTPGSKWWRFDFHSHTPASGDDGGGESRKAVEPEAWLAAVMGAGLDCVVVTDRDSGEWVDALRRKNQEIRERGLSRQLGEEARLRTRLRDVENDLRQYEEKGHGDILKRYQRRSQQKNGLPDSRLFHELSAGVRALAATELPDFPAHLFDGGDDTAAEVREIHEWTARGLKGIGASLARLADAVDALRAERRQKLLDSRWWRETRESEAACNALMEEYREKQGQMGLSLYGEWVAQRNRLQQRLNRLESVRKEVERTGKRVADTLRRLFDLRRELHAKRRDFLDKVIGDSAFFVRMELVPFGDVDGTEQEYRDILGLGDKFVAAVCDEEKRQGMLWEFPHWQAFGTPESGLLPLISEIESKILDIATGQARNAPRNNYGTTFGNRLKRLMESQPMTFDRLDAWWPEDMLRVEYSRGPASGRFDALEKGSAGQKAAAILAFLLSYGTDPLVIDQPEDDLDNALIHDLIVRRIHGNKHHRQLVIVTHNPNSIVNGDAELVHVLQFQNGRIGIGRQGGLEEAGIRDAICAMMEGGRQAFEKRYRRITLERI